MKRGLSIGHLEQLSVVVTEDMFPAFGGIVVHETMSTVAMVHHLEWVGRLVILPFLEGDEEGIGGGIAVEHIAPAPLGKTVHFFAEATGVTPRQVTCKVWAEHDKARVGEGTLTQFIRKRTLITTRIQEMK